VSWTKFEFQWEKKMSTVSAEEQEQFFADVDRAARKAIWAAVATVANGEPRLRMVHPTWEGSVLWFATSKQSPKAVQLAANSHIDVQYQVAAPDFVHLLVRGQAELRDDAATRAHVWEVMDYDLAEFWPAGVDDPDFLAVKILPQRVELSEMFGMANKRVWRG
jgi:general stress protein 26